MKANIFSDLQMEYRQIVGHLDGWMDRRIDGWMIWWIDRWLMDGQVVWWIYGSWMNGWTVGKMNRHMDGRTDWSLGIF